ncbi:MAG: hypothetical protein GKR91_11950 [Pseudomonadales bacterium]|nr:hypothetical protein [Pseudomonadales bacterium]
MITDLTKSNVLWISFFAVVALTLSFQFIAQRYGLVLLDGLYDPAEVRAAIANMTAQQRSVHVWVTSTLDVAYPIAYGIFFVGTAYKFFPTCGKYLALPALFCVPIDLVEGVIQVLALTTSIDWIQAKAILTPAKFALVLSALFITLYGVTKVRVLRREVM